MRGLVAVLLFLLTACTSPVPQETLAAKLLSSTVALQYDEDKTGCSGVAIDVALVVTAKHCLTSGYEVKELLLRDGRRLSIAQTWVSETYDVAFIRVDAPALRPVALATESDVQEGIRVIAVGHPFGRRWVITYGEVAKATASEPEYTAGDHLMHTARINPGNSGGGLFTEDGKLVGINNFMIQNSGLGFALKLKHILDERKLLIGG